MIPKKILKSFKYLGVKRRRKISRLLYLIAGSVFPIFIGALHTFVHFKDLVTLEVQRILQHEIIITSFSNQGKTRHVFSI